MIEVLEHIIDPESALKEAFRVSRRNVIISVPNLDLLPVMSKFGVVPWHILEATHVNFFTPKILKAQLRKHAKKIIVFKYGHFAPWITEENIYMHIMAIAYH